MKGQMKIGESMIILVIFFFLIVFGLVYYIQWEIRNIDIKSHEKLQLRAIQSVNKMQYLPELQCTNEGNVKFSCMDLLKLSSFSELTHTEPYGKIFPNSYVTVHQVYPAENEYYVYGRESSNKTIVFYVPTALFNATSGRYNLGYIRVGVHG